MNKTILLLIIFTAGLIAGELPDTPQSIARKAAGIKSDQEISSGAQAAPIVPIWNGLKKLSAAEQANAMIELELTQSASTEARQISKEIEQTWNAGGQAAALAKFEELEKIIEPGQIAIGISWRTPIPTENQQLTGGWGTDVRIGNRDSVNINVVDIHRSSGNMFVILTYPIGSSNYWSVNISSDDGSTWSETYTWFSIRKINSVSIAALANHCYVAYHQDDIARMRRYSAATAVSDTFGDGSNFVDIFTAAYSDTIKEITLISNQESFNNRLYYFVITKLGELRFFWDDQEALSWSEILTGIENADRGLDACWNEDYSTVYIFISYINKDHYLKIWGRSSGPLLGDVESGRIEERR